MVVMHPREIMKIRMGGVHSFYIAYDLNLKDIN
jgi:hypothetical protein